MGVLAALLVRDDLGEGTRRTHEDGTALGIKRNVVDDGAGGYETKGEDVSDFESRAAKHTKRERNSRRAHCVNSRAGLETLSAERLRVCEARDVTIRDALPEALDNGTGAQAVGCEDVAPGLLRPRIPAPDERNVRRATRVILDADDVVRGWLGTHEVDYADTTPVSATAETNGDVTMTVSSTLLSERDCELADGSALV